MRILATLSISAIFITALFAQPTLVEIKDLSPLDLEIAGFQLNGNQKINVEATGFHFERGRREIIIGDAWILNASTRDVVWEFQPSDRREDRDEATEQKADIDLPSGAYEVYFSTYPYFHNDWSYHSRRGIGHQISNFFANLFDGDYDYDDYRYLKDLTEDFRILIKGNGQKLDKSEIERMQDNLKREAAISLTANDNDLYLTQGFELKQPTELNIYAVGEARDDGNFDYGWIINTKTREKVWLQDYYDTNHAGGADKNRYTRETISLPAGKYAAIYVTDDSHSPFEWNSAVPHDPAFWGMTVRINPADRQNLSKFDYQQFEKDKVIYELTQVRDDDFEAQGFSLKKPMDLRIYALGEGRDGEMFDYGWIVNAKTHKKVWEMDYYDTDHAGGAQKNRLEDDVISLDKGDYIAYYATDGSHSYHDWNASPPYDPDHWGLTILAANDNFNRSDISDYEKKEDKNVLASIVRVRDHDYEHEKFTLNQDSEVRIYAIGEGRRGEMYDYGWIEDGNTGRVVWEMTYRKTDHAGGAHKNRSFNDTILLKKGNYTLYYESDDSHSFNDWNDTPPSDPMHWGISIYLVDEK